MIRRYLFWALAAYVAGISAMTWVNLAVLCRGDPKFDRGCGGFELYAPVGVIVLSPVLAAALMTGLAGPTPRRPGVLAAVAVAVTLVADVALEAAQGDAWTWGPVFVAAGGAALAVGIVRAALGCHGTAHRAEV